MKLGRTTLVAALATCIHAVTWAAPAAGGQTGLIHMPSADTLREGQFAIGFHDYKHWNEVNATFSLNKKIELGLAEQSPTKGKNAFLVSAKYNLFPEEILTPGLAVGVEDVADERERSAYVVASKMLPLGIRVHGGFGTGRFNGAFVGIEKTINSMVVSSGSHFPITNLIAEYDGQHWNYGVRMTVGQGFKLDAGRFNKDFFVGLSFTK